MYLLSNMNNKKVCASEVSYVLILFEYDPDFEIQKMFLVFINKLLAFFSYFKAKSFTVSLILRFKDFKKQNYLCYIFSYRTKIFRQSKIVLLFTLLLLLFIICTQPFLLFFLLCLYKGRSFYYVKYTFKDDQYKFIFRYNIDLEKD